MKEGDLSVESVDVILVSEIGMSSAALMKDRYLPPQEKDSDGNRENMSVQVSGSHAMGADPVGPAARVLISRLMSRTPNDVIEKVRKETPEPAGKFPQYVYYTVVLAVSIRLGDPATTRLINGMIQFILPPDVEILIHSPDDNSSITALINQSGKAISLSPALNFYTSDIPSLKSPADPVKNRFAIPVGSGEAVNGRFIPETGYSFVIPARSLLEYQGFLKNRHEVFWEIYPPMPPQETEIQGDVMLAVLSLIIRTPERTPPALQSRIECRVKGDLWGVISLAGSVDIPVQ